MRATLILAFILYFGCSVHATSYIPTSEYIKSTCDVVVYGVADFTHNKIIEIVDQQENLTKKLHQIVVKPYRFMPEFSPQYFWAYSYRFYLPESTYKSIKENQVEYTTIPRFWGIRRTFLFGNLGEPLSVQADPEFAKVESDLIEKFKDPMRMRPLDLEPLKKDFVMTADKSGGVTLTNNSRYRVYIHYVSGEYLASKKDSVSYRVSGHNDNGWIDTGYGLSGPYGAQYKKYNIPKPLEPGETIAFHARYPETNEYDSFQVNMFVYPDETFTNETAIVSTPFVK